MRRMGERRPESKSLKGMTLGMLTVLLISCFCIWRQDKLIDAALGKKKIVKQAVADGDDHPNAIERSFLQGIISKAMEDE